MTETQPKSKRKRRFLFWKVIVSIFMYLGVALVLGGVLMGGLGFVVYDQVARPGKPGEAVEVNIPAGASGKQVGAILAQEGLVAHAGFFQLAVKLDKSGKPIQHGIYDLRKGLSASQLLEELQAGPDRYEQMNQFRLTIPEGLAISQMADLFEDKEAFLEAARSPDLIARLGITADSLEGFLMPNTYFFDAPPAPREAVERMVAQFETEYAQLTEEIPGADEYDKYAIVTVASLVEEEAKAPEERPLVSAVLYNRLEKNMRLQLDATLAYITGKFGQRILDADKEADSPYNTYKYAGLPAGPISNPGPDCLRAALQPAKVDYLYFVSNADGRTHTFSSTSSEHERAVARYRRDIAEQRRAQGN